MHEALDLILDALEADARDPGPALTTPVRKVRRVRQTPPLPDPSTVRPEVLAAMSRRL